MIKKTKLALIIMFCSIISSCTINNGKTFLNTTETEDKGKWVISNTTPVFTQNQSSTSTPKIVASENFKSSQIPPLPTKNPYVRMPDLVINYGPNVQNFLNGFYLCDGKPQVFVLLSKFPYSDFTFIPQKTNFDQNFPSWDHDGERIAYVESDPEPYFDFDSDPVKKIGQDRIKIIDSQGNIQKENMQSLVRMDYHSIQNSCQPKSLIYNQASWSSDDQFMVFSYVDWGDPFIHRRYLLNVITDSIEIMIEETANWDNAIWFSGQNNFIDYDLDGLILVSIIQDGSKSITHYPWPFTADENSDVRFSLIQEKLLEKKGDSYKVKGVFSISDKDHAGLDSDLVSVWEFNFYLEKWEKLIDLSQNIRNPISINENLVAGCDENDQLLILDIQSQSFINKTLPEGNSINCNTFHLFQDELLKVGLSFWVEGNIGGLWIIDPYDQNSEPIQIIDQRNLPDISRDVPDDFFVPPFGFMNVIDYDWRPNTKN